MAARGGGRIVATRSHSWQAGPRLVCGAARWGGTTPPSIAEQPGARDSTGRVPRVRSKNPRGVRRCPRKQRASSYAAGIFEGRRRVEPMQPADPWPRGSGGTHSTHPDGPGGVLQMAGSRKADPARPLAGQSRLLQRTGPNRRTGRGGHACSSHPRPPICVGAPISGMRATRTRHRSRARRSRTSGGTSHRCGRTAGPDRGRGPRRAPAVRDPAGRGLGR